MKNIISFNLYFTFIFNFAICQLARTSYVDRGIRELKRDIEYDIKRLEKKIETHTKHISQIYPNGVPKEVYLYNVEDVKKNKPYQIVTKIQYENNGNLKQITHLYESGQKEEQTNYKDGRENGLRTVWYESGQKKEQTNYKDGRENGLRTAWFESGQKEEQTNYKDGRKNGLRTVWVESGQIIREENYNDGELHGVIRTYYLNGNLAYKGLFKHGNEEDVSINYFKNGNIYRKIFWTKGDIDSLFTLSKNKKNFSLMLVNDEKMFNNGEYNFWSDNDSLFILETINYQNGKKNGRRTTYNPNGSELKVENCIEDECN